MRSRRVSEWSRGATARDRRHSRLRLARPQDTGAGFSGLVVVNREHGVDPVGARCSAVGDGAAAGRSDVQGESAPSKVVITRVVGVPILGQCRRHERPRSSLYLLPRDWRRRRAAALPTHRYYNPGSLRFLRSVGVGGASRVLEVGCGQGQMAHLIAGELGPDGQVVGVDASDAQIEAAARTDSRRGKCRWVRAHADALSEVGGPFDLVYSRFKRR